MRWVILGLLVLAACSVAEPGCCKALTASCMACAEGVTEEEYCTTNPETVGCPDYDRKEAMKTDSLEYNDLFGYESVKSVVYEANVQGTTFTVESTVEEEIGAYKLTAVYNGDDSTQIIMRINMETHACLDTYTETLDSTEVFDCPTEGLNSVNVGSEELTFVREEHVHILGDHDAFVWELDGIEYWLVDDKLPVPVRYGNDEFVMTLVSYE